MNDKQIEIFLTAAECGSFSKSEKHLYLSRQAIMKQINQLEAEMGIQLFVRTPTGLTLTDVGIIFRDGLIPIRRQMKDLLTTCHQAADKPLRLCVEIPRHPRSLLDQAIARYNNRYPNVQLEILRDSSAGRTQRLRDKKIDIAEIPRHEEFSFHDLMYLHLVDKGFSCLVTADHPLAQKTSIRAYELQDYRVYVNNLLRRRKLIDCLHETMPSIRFFETTGEEYASILNVCYNRGVYITPAHFASQMEFLVAIPLDCALKQEFGLIYRPEPNEAVDWFIEVVREVLGISPVHPTIHSIRNTIAVNPP